MLNAGIELPEIGFELIVNSTVVGQAEMAWGKCKLALLHEADYQFEEIFIKNGWKTIRLDDFVAELDKSIIDLKDIMKK